MGEDPGRIRREIEETREQYAGEPVVDVVREDITTARTELGDTMSALGHKADVKSRVKESVSSKKDSLVGGFSSGKDAVVGKADSLVSSVTGVVHDKGQLADGARKVGMSKENPLGLAIGGAAAGFIVGLLMPSTRIEDEKIGETADQLKETVKETGHEAMERGKQVAQEAVGAAKQTAEESAQQQGGQMSQSLKESARAVASSTRESQE
jgi:gas vesicle protein